MKIDLDKIALKASEHRTHVPDSLHGHCAMTLSRVGATPEETIALIARIRELEALLVEERNDLRDYSSRNETISATGATASKGLMRSSREAW